MTKLFWAFWPLCISDVYKNVWLQMDLTSIDIGDPAASPQSFLPSVRHLLGKNRSANSLFSGTRAQTCREPFWSRTQKAFPCPPRTVAQHLKIGIRSRPGRMAAFPVTRSPEAVELRALLPVYYSAWRSLRERIRHPSLPTADEGYTTLAGTNV